MLATIVAAALVSFVSGSKGPLTIYSAPALQYGSYYVGLPDQELYQTQYGVTPSIQTLWAAGYPSQRPVQAGGAYIVVNQGIPTIHDIYDKPMVLITKSESGGEQITACIVKDGLVSLGDNPCTHHVHKALHSGQQKKGFLFYPRALDVGRLYPVKNLKVNKFAIPKGITLKNLANIVSSEIPYLFVDDAEQFNKNIKTWGLFEVAQVDASLRQIKVNQYPAGPGGPGAFYERYKIESSAESSKESLEQPKYPWPSSSTTYRPDQF